ncbi:MAG: hypothetical protein AB7U82_09035 [Blastocatellales bacterium]
MIEIGAEFIEHSPEKLSECGALYLVRQPVRREVVNGGAEGGEIFWRQIEPLHERIEVIERELMLGAENQKLQGGSKSVP